MWDSVSGPLRCLDEFDVFLDAPNRMKALPMLVQGARVADSKQFILITPLGCGDASAWGAEVRVHTLAIEDRRSGTLAGSHR